MIKPPIKDRTALLECMVRVRDVLSAKGIPVFLTFGTLLGALREKGFIPHDYDADMEIYEKDEQAFLECLPELAKLGIEMFEYTDFENLYKFRSRGERLDVFVARERRMAFGRRAWYVDGRTTVPARLLDSLVELDFLGYAFKVPADSVGLVRNLYGKNWRVPIVNYPARLDWSVRLKKVSKKPLKIPFYIHRFITMRLGWDIYSYKARR